MNKSQDRVLRAILILDTLTDVRMIEGLADVFSLTVVVPSSLPRTTPNPLKRRVHVERLDGGRLSFVWRAAWWLMGRRSTYDVVFAMDNLTAALAANLSKFVTSKPTLLILGRPTVDYFKCRRRTWHYWLELVAVRLLVRFNEGAASLNLPVTRHMASQMKSRLVTIVPWYGVDTEKFASLWTRSVAREMLGLSSDRKIVFCRSRIAPEKDPETFLKAIRTLRSDFGKEVLVLYVGGEFREFVSQAQSYGLDIVAKDHVHPTDQLPIYYRAADVTVQTSKAEGLALSTLESLSCETPVVASAVGGMVETIQPRVTGLTAPVGDHVAIARSISWMLDHPEEAQNMARRGREMVIEHYSAQLAFRGYQIAAESVVPSQFRPKT